MAKAKGYIALSSVSLFWGLSIIAAKIALQSFTPFSLAAMRFLLSTPMLLIILLVQRQSLRVARQHRKWMFMAGFVGIFLHIATQIWGINLLSASLASILLSSAPAFAVLIDRLIFKIPLTGFKLFSVSLSIAGVVLVVGFDAGAGNLATIVGSLLTLVAALALVGGGYFTARLQHNYSPVTVTFYQNLVSAVCFFPLMLASPPVSWNISATGWVAILFLALFCSALGFLLYNYALKTLPISVCSIFINLIPVITIAVGVLTLGESIGPLQLCGAGLVLASVVATSKAEEAQAKALARRQKKKEEEAEA